MNQLIVPYKYQMTYEEDSRMNLSSIIETLEDEINLSLVKSSGFVRCGGGGTPMGSRLMEQSSMVLGIGSEPKDVVTSEFVVLYFLSL